MTPLESRIRTGLHETAERIPDTPPITAAPRRSSTRPTGVWIAVAAVATVVILFTPILLLDMPDPDTTPAGDPGQFGGEWITDQSDATTHTMTIEVSGTGSAEMIIEDDFALVCSGGPFQVIGTGSLQTDNTLVFSSPRLACKDGSQPEASSGPPLEEQYQNLTFTYDAASDTLTDSLGLLWTRGIANTPGINWPQTSMEEVQEAQRLADAGDPDFAWQLEPNMESILQGASQDDIPEIIARFLKKELGWEEFALIGTEEPFQYGGFEVVGAQLVRCQPGKSNPFWPNDPVFGGCAPTIDDFQYESVFVNVTQPDKQGSEGLWVASFLTEAEPFWQIAPITDVEIAALMDAFLQARIAGEGAEQYLGTPDDLQHFEIGYLYETSTGSPYERGEFEIEEGEIEDQGPQWGGIGLKVRLYADSGQTVVEQTFELEARGDHWKLYQHDEDQNTENGVALPRP